jgi:hypothetical protein
MSQADLGLITDLFFLEKKLETNKKQKQSKTKQKQKQKKKYRVSIFISGSGKNIDHSRS